MIFCGIKRAWIARKVFPARPGRSDSGYNLPVILWGFAGRHGVGDQARPLLFTDLARVRDLEMGLRFQRLALGWSVGLCVAGTGSATLGQLSDNTRASVAATIEADRGKLNSLHLPNIEAIESAIKVAVANIDQHFRSRTSEANRAAWMEYLATDRLVAAIDNKAKMEEIVKHAERTRGRLVADQAGLELAPVIELRRQVDQLIAASRFSDGEKSIKFIDQQLTSLEERLLEADAVPSAEQASALGAITRVIYESNQSAAVPVVMQSAFAQPNVVITVNSGLIQSAASRAVDRCRPVNDCILGTRVVGTGHLVGAVSARTLPAYGQVAVELTLNAQFSNRNKGYNGPVTVDTSGHGTVTSSRTIYLSEAGVTLGPTITQASLSTQIDSINHPLRLVRKIASRRAAEQKPKAEVIGREKLRQQVGSEFATQVEEAVRIPAQPERQTAFAQARTTLTRLDLPEPKRMIGSSSDSVFLHATQAGVEQLAAANPAPSLLSGSYDLAIQLHESTIDNIASRVFAGRTMSRDQLDRLITRTGRPAPTAANADEEEEAPFIIDFAKLRPIIFEARAQSLKVGIRGTRFKQGERELKQSLEITATYIPVRLMDGTMYLERQGDVTVDFPGNRRLTIQQVALRRSIQKLFANRFPPQLLTQSLNLPSTLPIETLRGRNLRTSGIDSRDGWLSLTAR